MSKCLENAGEKLRLKNQLSRLSGISVLGTIGPYTPLLATWTASLMCVEYCTEDGQIFDTMSYQQEYVEWVGKLWIKFSTSHWLSNRSQKGQNKQVALRRYTRFLPGRRRTSCPTFTPVLWNKKKKRFERIFQEMDISGDVLQETSWVVLQRNLLTQQLN